MSLVMLASVGLQPISQAVTGALMKLSLAGLFYSTGILMVLVALWLAFQPATRTVHVNLANSVTNPGGTP